MEKILFKTLENENFNLWIYDEENAATRKNRTAMVWIHGGGWYSGDPDYFGDDYDFFTKKGIVCFGVEYRLVLNKENDLYANRLCGAVEDCIDAVLFIKEHSEDFGIDPDKIVVVGESAGGHLALCFATDVVNRINKAALPNAVIAYNPVIETIGRWSASAGRIEGVNFDTEGFYKRYNILKGISPIHNIVKNNIPLLLLTGIDDKCVYPGEVVDFYEKYKSMGNKAEIELYPKTGHAFALPFWYDNDRVSLNKSLNTIETFLKEYGFQK